MIVIRAEGGGTFRETIALAHAYTDARKQHGQSELLDEIVSSKPQFDRHRYRTDADPHSDSGAVDGLPGSEGAFLACSFWLADALALTGRRDEARELFERLLELRNDVGLLSEEWDPHARRQLGNTPQAFSHVGLVNTALALETSPGHTRTDTPAGASRR